jgi:hypothetical protein
VEGSGTVEAAGVGGKAMPLMPFPVIVGGKLPTRVMLPVNGSNE